MTGGVPDWIDRQMGRERNIDRDSDDYRSGSNVGTVLGVILPIPGPGKVGAVGKGGRFLYDSWYKSTLPSKSFSVAYHTRKHGMGNSAVKYTQDALNFYQNNKHLGVPVTLKDGSPGILIKTGKKQPGGYFTPSGQVVTFWYR